MSRRAAIPLNWGRRSIWWHLFERTSGRFCYDIHLIRDWKIDPGMRRGAKVRLFQSLMLDGPLTGMSEDLIISPLGVADCFTELLLLRVPRRHPQVILPAVLQRHDDPQRDGDDDDREDGRSNPEG